MIKVKGIFTAIALILVPCAPLMAPIEEPRQTFPLDTSHPTLVSASVPVGKRSVDSKTVLVKLKPCVAEVVIFLKAVWF